MWQRRASLDIRPSHRGLGKLPISSYLETAIRSRETHGSICDRYQHRDIGKFPVVSRVVVLFHGGPTRIDPIITNKRYRERQ